MSASVPLKPQQPAVPLLLAAHGTRSSAGSATTRALAAAVGAARPGVPVSLCFLDVDAPSLAAALDGFGNAPVVIVPLLLSAGYHVHTDIPGVVAGRTGVRVAAHLGPDRLVLDAVADRLAEAGGGRRFATTVLAAVGSSQRSARDEVDVAADALALRLGRPVRVLPLGPDATLDDAVEPVEVASYLLAEGGFLDALRQAVADRGVVAAPIGTHPALINLVWDRYDATAG